MHQPCIRPFYCPDMAIKQKLYANGQQRQLSSTRLYNSQMQKIYDAIIIGAGISGIAASLSLSRLGVEHIVLEARSRIGGRMLTKQIDGVPLHLGANFIYFPHKNNKIAELAKEINVKTVPLCQNSQQYLYQGRGQISVQLPNKANDIFEKLKNTIREVMKNREDTSIAEASRQFYANFQGEQEVLNILKWKQGLVAIGLGAELNQLSAKDYVKQEKDVGEFVVMPEGAYTKIVQTLYDPNRPEVRLGEAVTQINYSQKIVEIHTKSNNVYHARKVISSLPLGWLHRGLVQFYPKLPETHLKALQKIGNGVVNKLFLTFQQPFWDESKDWISFITKQQSRYPRAMVVKQQKRAMICISLSKATSLEVHKLTDEEVANDFLAFLKKFNLKTEVKMKAFKMTRWHRDPFAQGAYSYFKVGTTSEDFKALKSPIDNKLWFIGQHCNPTLNAFTHSAFDTGLQAAEQVKKSLTEQH